MTAMDTLLKQVVALRDKVGSPDAPRVWFFCVPYEDEIPLTLRQQFRPSDSVGIRFIPPGWLGDLSDTGYSIGHLRTLNDVRIIWPDGQLEKVKRENRRRH